MNERQEATGGETEVFTSMVERPPPIRTDGSNAFAHHSMAVRVPGIIADVVDRNPPMPQPMKQRLLALRDEIAGDAPLRLFDPPAPDHDLWRRLFAAHEGDTWLNAEWFFCEMYSYRLVLHAVRYWCTHQDPFAPHKDEEMDSQALWTLLDRTLDVQGTLDERLEATLNRSLWGNRIDLSLSSVASHGTEASDEHLLSNDVAEAVRHLRRGRPGDVHLIMDNAGTEEAMDLAVADLLLTEQVAERVFLHVKMQPVLVSDVVAHDIHTLIGRMNGRGGRIEALGDRVRSRMETDRLIVVPDFFWNTAGRIWELPPRLAGPFVSAALVIAKGDVNYRRLTNDAFWPPGSSFRAALADVRFPLLALRTLKSDTVLGIDEETWRRLDASHHAWRTDGRHGVAQFTIGGAGSQPA